MAIQKKPVAKKTTPAPRRRKPKSDVPRPEIHAKQITILVSVGTEDRERSHEKFVEDVLKAIKSSRTANVKRATAVSGYYILDGKVCLPSDYDPETQNFKPGATPPAWAGGPSPTRTVVERTGPVAPKFNSRISKEEADRRIAAGKAKYAAQHSHDEDEEFEDFTEWEVADASNTAKLEAIADESIKKNTATTPKKRVIKKATTGSASASKKVAPKPAPAKKTTPSRRRRTV